MTEVAGLVIAGLSLAYGGYAGERQATAQRKGAKNQREAQQTAESNALKQERLGEQEATRARQKTPDLDVLLGDLTKPKQSSLGINQSQLLLGNRFLGGTG